jgi:hypothetical protein
VVQIHPRNQRFNNLGHSPEGALSFCARIVRYFSRRHDPRILLDCGYNSRAKQWGGTGIRLFDLIAGVASILGLFPSIAAWKAAGQAKRAAADAKDRSETLGCRRETQ